MLYNVRYSHVKSETVIFGHNSVYAFRPSRDSLLAYRTIFALSSVIPGHHQLLFHG
jgi:hypothetical protein